MKFETNDLIVFYNNNLVDNDELPSIDERNQSTSTTSRRTKASVHGKNQYEQA
jgi:hypothetical protein